MLLPRIVVGMFSIGVMFFDAGITSAQSYPNKPIHVIAPATGGGADLAARLIAQGITGPLGQPVVVENRPGGAILGQIVSKAQPDGYTLLLTGNTLWLLPLLQNNVPFDPVNDFAPISLIASAPLLLIVHPSVPANSVQELIALARAGPGKLNYAAAFTGSQNHLAGELFKTMASINIVAIPYKGLALALNDLMGGHVQLMFATPAAARPHVKSGRLRALAVTSAKPSALFPGMPTVGAAGLPGYESEGALIGMFAPTKTPEAIITRLNQEIVRVLNMPDVKEKFLNSGVEAVGGSPEEFAMTMKSDMAKWGKLIRDLGIRAE